MRREIRKAKSLGLKVMLKPHVWVAGGRWRGEIDVGDSAAWRRWFESYRRWILGYADMAQTEGADILVVGVELRSTESRLAARWRELIDEARERFNGKLTYSANWDDVANVSWWDALDYIGVQFYPPLATTERVDLEQVRDNVAARLDDLAPIANRHARPVLLTEVGYRAASDALVIDWHAYGWVYVFAFAIGFATTIAEPSLLAVAMKASETSGGAISVWGLRVAVAIGVAVERGHGTARLPEAVAHGAVDQDLGGLPGLGLGLGQLVEVEGPGPQGTLPGQPSRRRVLVIHVGRRAEEALAAQLAFVGALGQVRVGLARGQSFDAGQSRIMTGHGWGPLV